MSLSVILRGKNRPNFASEMMFFVFFLCFLLPRGENYLIFTSDKCQLVLRSSPVACPGFPLPVILGLPGYLLLLQRLFRIGAGSAERLPEDGAQGDRKGNQDTDYIYDPDVCYLVSELLHNS